MTDGVPYTWDISTYLILIALAIITGCIARNRRAKRLTNNSNNRNTNLH